jgi:hypothetical protein
MVVALQSVGLIISTVNTICSKTITFYVVRDSVESGGESADYTITKDYSGLPADFLINATYEDISFNQADFTLFSDDTKTTVLAVGLNAINTYLSDNSAIGSVIQCEATPSFPAAVGYVRLNYRDFPSSDWFCGEQQYAGRERVLVTQGTPTAQNIASLSTTPYTSPNVDTAFTFFTKVEGIQWAAATSEGNFFQLRNIANIDQLIRLFIDAAVRLSLQVRLTGAQNWQVFYTKPSATNAILQVVFKGGTGAASQVELYVNGSLYTTGKGFVGNPSLSSFGTTNRQLLINPSQLRSTNYKIYEASMIVGEKTPAEIAADFAAGTMSGADADFYFKVRPTFPSNIRSLIPTNALGGRFVDTAKGNLLNINNKPNPMDIFNDFDLI